jgi:hypothetical protein
MDVAFTAVVNRTFTDSAIPDVQAEFGGHIVTRLRGNPQSAQALVPAEHHPNSFFVSFFLSSSDNRTNRIIAAFHQPLMAGSLYNILVSAEGTPPALAGDTT